MKQTYGQPGISMSPQKNGDARSPNSTKHVTQEDESKHPPQAITRSKTPAAPSLNNSHVNKAKTCAFMLVFGLIILASGLKLSSCSISMSSISGDEFCKLYLGYLIASCAAGLVYLLTNVGVYCKGSDTIHLACLPLFLFDNHRPNFCEGWTGVLIAIFVIVVAPIALLIFGVTVLRHWQHERGQQETKGQTSENAMNHEGL